MGMPGYVGRLGLAASIAVSLLSGSAGALAAQAPAGEQNREGFTLILDLGLGFQRDEFIGTTETGLGGLNLGIGGFVTEDLALMLRISGTNVDYGGLPQVSGFGGPALQYWPNDRLGLTGGVGMGFWEALGVDDTGLGLVFGAQYAILRRTGYNLFLGVDYAPAFTDPATVHNFAILFGWQLL